MISKHIKISHKKSVLFYGHPAYVKYHVSHMICHIWPMFRIWSLTPEFIWKDTMPAKVKNTASIDQWHTALIKCHWVFESKKAEFLTFKRFKRIIKLFNITVIDPCTSHDSWLMCHVAWLKWAFSLKSLNVPTEKAIIPAGSDERSGRFALKDLK